MHFCCSILQTGQADIDPVTLHHLQQQESLINMVFFASQEDSSTLLQTDSSYYDYPIIRTLFQFVSEHGNSNHSIDDHVPRFHQNKVRGCIATIYYDI